MVTRYKYQFVVLICVFQYARSEIVTRVTSNSINMCIKNILSTLHPERGQNMLVVPQGYWKGFDETPKDRQLEEEIAEEVVSYILNHDVIITDVKLAALNQLRSRIENIIILTNSASDIDIFVDRWINVTTSHSGNKFFLLYSGPGADINQIFSKLWHVYAYRVILLDSGENIYVQEELSSENCKLTTGKVAATCEEVVNNISLVKTVFDRVYTNYQGCPIYALTTPSSAPYIINVTSEENKGLEPLYMDLIAKSLNFTLIYVNHNYTGFGMLRYGPYCCMYKGFYEREADIMFGMLYASFFIPQYFDVTMPSLFVNMPFYVPLAKRQSPWLDMTRIFSPSAWLLYFAGFLVFIPIYTLFQNYENSQDRKHAFLTTSLYVYTIALNESVNLPLITKHRILLISWIIFSFIYSSLYESTFVSFLVHPIFEKQIKTPQDIIESGYTIHGSVEASYTFEMATDTTSRLIFKQWKVISLGETVAALEDVAKYRKSICVAGNKRVSYEMKALKRYIDKHRKPTMYATKPFINYFLWIVTQKGLPLLNGLNTQILILQETGLMDYFEKKYTFILSRDEESEYFPIGLDNILLVFFIYVGGISLAMCAFVAEHCQFRSLVRDNAGEDH